MSEDTTNVVPMVSRASRLADALQRVRAREQLRGRDALPDHEGRLEVLASELRAMVDDLPPEDAARFVLSMTHNGERLSIDGAGYVELAPETQTYRLVHEQSDGVSILTETADREAMADGVADYMAERIVERERLAKQSPSVSATAGKTAPPPSAPVPEAAQKPASRFWPGFWLFVLGGVCSATALFTYAWLQAG